jgi:REP element-mobilizing transposase RayT
MLNHIHLIINSNYIIDFVRGYKSYTSKLLKQNIKQTEPNILKLFSDKDEYQFWGKTNMPRVIESEKFYNQKLEYIHNNPVKKNYVILPEYWYWSSANEKCRLKVR